MGSAGSPARGAAEGEQGGPEVQALRLKAAVPGRRALELPLAPLEVQGGLRAAAPGRSSGSPRGSAGWPARPAAEGKEGGPGSPTGKHSDEAGTGATVNAAGRSGTTGGGG